jgi:hypothetical protein
MFEIPEKMAEHMMAWLKALPPSDRAPAAAPPGATSAEAPRPE